MNKKSAFSATAQYYQNMAFKKVFNGLSALIARRFLMADYESIAIQFCKNIYRVNKPTNSLL